MKLSAIIVLCCSMILVSATEEPVSVEPPPTNKTTTTIAPRPSPTPPSNKTTTTIAPSPRPSPTPPSNKTTTTIAPSPPPSPTPPSNATTTTAPSPPPSPTPPSNSTTTKAPSPPPSPTPPSNSTTTTTTTIAPPSNKTTTTTPTPPAPTPTPTPSPVPEPTTGSWVLNATNEICIVIKMATQFNVTYLTTDNKTVIQKINLPSDNTTQVSGNCSSSSEQVMTISWMNGTNNMTMHFINHGKTYSLHHIEAVISNVNLPKINSNYSMNLNGEIGYKASSGNSYKCAAEKNIEIKTNLNDTTAHIRVSNLQFQAFKTGKSSDFGSADDCADVPSIVPIAVGCVLIALVVLVLVAYLVGRRNSQARGYVSM